MFLIKLVKELIAFYLFFIAKYGRLAGDPPNEEIL